MEPLTTEQTPSPHIRPIVRVVLGLVSALAAGFGALVAWFVGIVVYTGCFIGCGDPNRPVGSLLMALAAALTGVIVAGVDYAFRGWDRRRSTRMWLIGAVIGSALSVASLVAG